MLFTFFFFIVWVAIASSFLPLISSAPPDAVHNKLDYAWTVACLVAWDATGTWGHPFCRPVAQGNGFTCDPDTCKGPYTNHQNKQVPTPLRKCWPIIGTASRWKFKSNGKRTPLTLDKVGEYRMSVIKGVKDPTGKYSDSRYACLKPAGVFNIVCHICYPRPKPVHPPPYLV